MTNIANFRTHRYLAILCLTALVVGITGCDDPAQSSQEDPRSRPLTDASMRGFGNPPGKSLSPDDFDIETLSGEMAAFDRKVASASNWKEAHRKVRDLLASPSSAPQFILEQSAAHAMFREYLATDRWHENLTEEKVEALGFYTNLLVDNRSPEGDLVYTGLKNLEGQWSERRIAEAADTTVRAAERKYGSEGAKRSQSASEQPASSAEDDPTPGLAEGRERRAIHVMEASEKLERMVDRLEGDA